MKREILINITPMETRVALVDNGVPQEISIERNQRSGLVGNIYKGKVVRILPGMQAAFVDIGVERAGFLHVDDLVASKPKKKGESGESESPEIQDLLHDGQKILVQVIKDPINSKGARLTAQLSVASRYLVYMDGGEHIGVSQRIEDEEERERLKAAITATIEELAAAEPPVKRQKHAIEIPQRRGGYILRTAAEGASVDELRVDVRYLQRVWQHLMEVKAEAALPSCLYEELPLYKRVLRDMASTEVEKVLVDSREVLDLLVKFANKFKVPVIATNDSHYINEDDANAHDILLCINTGEKQATPGFDDFVNDELQIKNRRFKFPNNEFYFKTQEEMKALFSDIPESIDNTNAIVDKVDVLNLKKDILLNLKKILIIHISRNKN